MTDDLKKRLARRWPNEDPKTHAEKKEAMQRIEQLEAKLRWVLDERDATFALMLKRAETAEAKLTKVEAAIHRITPYLSASLSELDCGPDYIDACNQAFEADSITLAELTGGKDD